MKIYFLLQLSRDPSDASIDGVDNPTYVSDMVPVIPVQTLPPGGFQSQGYGYSVYPPPADVYIPGGARANLMGKVTVRCID
jgi:hypothetical protein